ncbi:hypothetical protein Esti_004569 [Eimeria stiedai]
MLLDASPASTADAAAVTAAALAAATAAATAAASATAAGGGGHGRRFRRANCGVFSAANEASPGLLRALGRRGGGPSSVSLEAFVDKCNRRLQCSGMQIQAGFDGEASALSLRSMPGLELSREEGQKAGPKLHLMGEADVACAADKCARCSSSRSCAAGAAVALPAFVRLCAEHRVASAPQLLRWLLELRWVEAEAPVCASDGRQLTLGPSFYLVRRRCAAEARGLEAACMRHLQTTFGAAGAALQPLPRRVPPGLPSRDAQQTAAPGARLAHLLLLRRSVEACVKETSAAAETLP